MSERGKRLHENVKTICLSAVQVERVDWFWLGYIPYGNITILQGDPGAGKGTTTIDLIARATTGRPMPNSELLTEPINVILLTTAEDDLAATIKPRLLAAGADCDRVFAFPDLLAIPDDLAVIETAVIERNARLIVIDPLNAYLGGSIDGHKDQDIRRALSPLKAIAAQYGVAVVLVHHMNKSGSMNALYRGGGSIGIVGAARSVLLAAENPKQEGQRIIARVKGNLSAPPPALAYRIETAAEYNVPVIAWEGVTQMSANELLVEASPREIEANKREQAKAFLTKYLANGSKPTKRVEQEAATLGIRDRTLDEARKSMGIKSEKRGNIWWMRLPKEERNEETAPEPVASLRPCTLDEDIFATIADQNSSMEQEGCKDARAQECNALFDEVFYDLDGGADFEDEEDTEE